MIINNKSGFPIVSYIYWFAVRYLYIHTCVYTSESIIIFIQFLLSGEPHICQNLSQYGHGKGTIYGGCSEYSIVPARYAYLLKTNLDDSKAVILERK